MDHKALISALGGASRLHSQLTERGVEVEQVTVRSWTLQGRAIPAKYWVAVKEIADALGVPVSYEGLAKSVSADAPERNAQAA